MTILWPKVGFAYVWTALIPSIQNSISLKAHHNHPLPPHFQKTLYLHFYFPLNPRPFPFCIVPRLTSPIHCLQLIQIKYCLMSDHQLAQGQQKSLDSTSALQKVLRLDKKHTNFDYTDPIRSITLRINYPQIVSEGPSSETLLKSLWKHANNYYFKKIEETEYERLKYLESVLRSPNEGSHRFIAEEEFWTLIRSLFSEKYLQRYLLGDRDRLDYHDWLEYLNLTWKVITSTDHKEYKRNVEAYEILKSNLKEIYKLDDVTLTYKLELEKEELGKFLEEEDDFGDDEVSEEIRRLEREIEDSNDQIADIFAKLQERVEYEAAVQEIIFCESGVSSLQAPGELSASRAEHQRMQRKIQRLNNFQVQTQYIQYIIRILQNKQIAQSISKFYRLEKQKGETRIQLHFQQSMGIKPITISQPQFTAINQLREYSLLKYYNTASKSRYSFICQNYLGFKDIYQNRNKPCKYKNRDILQQMKKSSVDSLHSNYYKEFNRMEICHHCKLLHHQDNLVTCEYHSHKYGNPIPPSPYYDSYVYQILKNEQSRVSAIRFLNSSDSRRNSYFYYNKENDQYICGRKYCKYCLKNYDDGKEKSNGLCPYCRAICYCTRCSRNDMMIRLKSMYILMGGDINKLQRASLFEKYYQSLDQQMDLRKKDKSGKTPSRKAFNVPNRMNEKMVNIRYQLEDLRIMCDLVKRREKNKEKLLGCQKDIFRKKVEQHSEDFYQRQIERVEERERSSSSESRDVKLNEKLAKKLRRMIS